MASAAELVNNTFQLAQGYAQSAQQNLTSFADRLKNAIYTPPTLSVTWTTLGAPTLAAMPTAPAMPSISFDPGILGNAPSLFNEAAPNLAISDFTDVAPDLNLPTAPAISYGAIPAVPSIGTVAIPDAPTVTMPAVPTYVTINAVPFGGIDLHDEWLESLGDRPTLELVAPTPYSYSRGPEYASELLSKLKSVLDTRMSGGTGLDPAVEQAIWDRGRSRETQIALANQAEVMRTSESFGFPLPTGVLAAQLRDAQRDYYDKLSGLSRDIAIKQADLEQENLKSAIAAGMQLEQQLITYSYQMEQLSFEASKALADNAIQIHNAAIEQFKGLLQGYQTYASVYKTIIDGQLAKVEVFKAQLQGELAKAEINKVLVEQYKAQIEAGMSQVKIYEAQVGAAKTLVELEQAKIGAAGEQIRAYVAQVNAETSKVEAYKASVQAEATKIDIWKTKAQVYGIRVGAQAEHSRALISRYQALISAKTGEWEGYRARVLAESTRIEALGKQSGALLDGFRAETQALSAQAELQTKVWESNMKQYEAGVQVAMQAAKINNDAAIQTNNARMDAAKAGTQVFAQLTSSAYSMMHANAGISGSASMGVSYSYSGDVTGTVPAISSPG